MVKPAYLKKGDKIAIVAPAKKISKEELAPAIQILKSWGLEVVLGKNLFQEQHQFSGSDVQRTDDFQTMLEDPSINAILCARGGYGTVRIIDQLDFSKFKKHPKWIIGYSDITILHSHIHKMGIESLHATMPINMSQDDPSKKEAIESLRNALFGEPINYEVESHSLNKSGNCVGELIGGNLSILYSLIGCESDIDTRGKILFLEDLDEYLYHVDRMMMSLKRANKLSKLAGLIVGGMTDMNDNKIPFGRTAEEIISEAVKEYDYPVCFNFPAGHIANNMALYMGRKAKLEISASVKLNFIAAEISNLNK